MFNRKDFILYKKRMLSEEDCKRIIHYFETHSELYKDGQIGGRVVEYDKKSIDISMNFYDKTRVSLWILDCLNQSVYEYMRHYPFIDEISSWNVNASFNLQKYKPTEGYFKLHCENDGTNQGQERRILAWMIYLNDVTDGGETEFPTQGKKFQPRTGDVLIWPAYWTHPHRGITSKTETKYIATGWYCFNEP